MALKSAPPDNKWVAKAWRNAWGVVYDGKPNSYLRFSTLLWIILGDNSPPLFPKKSGSSPLLSNGQWSIYCLTPSQIIGKRGDDLKVIAFAKKYEEIFNYSNITPKY